MTVKFMLFRLEMTPKLNIYSIGMSKAKVGLRLSQQILIKINSPMSTTLPIALNRKVYLYWVNIGGNRL
jgi:hypothetical protein